MGRLLEFYQMQVLDDEGRRLDQIWQWEMNRLEGRHNYIQWLFPTEESSYFNPQAPVLSNGDVEAFKKDKDLQLRLLRSFEMMLRFYGFKIMVEDNKPVIKPGKNWSEQSKNWLKPHNHNFFRITRIINSLHTLGLKSHAQAFYDALEELCAKDAFIAEIIGPITRMYWKRAVTGTLEA